MRVRISVILFSLVLLLTGPRSFASRELNQGSNSKNTAWSFYSESLDALVRLGRAEFKFTEEVCDRNPNSTICAWAKWRLQDIEHEILSNPVFPRNYQPGPIRKCLYAGMLACSLLGGPDPADQGLTPWSSLSGQELADPLELYKKQSAESGSDPHPGRRK